MDETQPTAVPDPRRGWSAASAPYPGEPGIPRSAAPGPGRPRPPGPDDPRPRGVPRPPAGPPRSPQRPNRPGPPHRPARPGPPPGPPPRPPVRPPPAWAPEPPPTYPDDDRGWAPERGYPETDRDWAPERGYPETDHRGELQTGPGPSVSEHRDQFGRPDLTAPSPSDPAPAAWTEERSLLGPRLAIAVVAVLAVTVAVCIQILPRAATPPKTLMKDAFDRTAAGLGSTDTGQAWTVPTPGAWSTADGEAFVAEPNPDPAGRTMALIDIGSDNGSVTATIAGSSAGWGLVFRYRGPSEFWTLTSSAKFASYNITHVTKGRAEPVDKLAMARQSPGTVVTVQFQGPQVTLLLDGRPAKTVTDRDGGNGGHQVGLVLVDGSTTEARWKAFEARRLPLSPDSRLTTTSSVVRAASTTSSPGEGG